MISTNLFLNVGGVQGKVKAQLEGACSRGSSSLYISGVNPGWINTMTTAMTAVCRQVESVSISESANCAVYESAETWLAMGMSLPQATPAVIETARNWEVTTRIRFIPPKSWGNHEWDTMTAMPAVNAAFNVKAARPGVLSLGDVCLPCAPAGVWLGTRS